MRLQSSVAHLEAGGQSRPHTQVGFNYYGNPQGSMAQLDNILARLSKTEADNARLTQELQDLRPGNGGPSEPFPGSVPSSGLEPGQDMENRLPALESAGDLETVSLGSQTFKSIQDCETFLYLHAPNDVLDMYAYDMVSLIHHIGRDINASGAVQCEHTAMKVGGKTFGSASLFASFQQALPGPFGVALSIANSSPIPFLLSKTTLPGTDKTV
jgi:hypothetical protein